MSNKKHAIAVLSDAGHLSKARQIFYSSFVYGNWQGDYLLLAHEVKDNGSLWWFSSRGIHIIHTRHLAETGYSPHDSRSVYFGKLQLFHPELSIWDTIIYLDTDMLVRKDLKALTGYGARFGAADDCFRFPLSHQFRFCPDRPFKELIKEYEQQSGEKLKVSLKKTSFNAGMMVIDSTNNTRQRYENLLRLTRIFGPYSVKGDQGILNLYFQAHRRRIPYVYNDYYQSDDFNRNSLIARKSDKDAVILHLIYPHKPWEKDSPYNTEWEHNTAHSHLLFHQVTPCGKEPSWWSIIRTELINRLNIRRIKTIVALKKTYDALLRGKKGNA